MVQRPAGWIFWEPNGGRSIGLGVAIDEKGRLFDGCEARGQIHSRCGLSYAAFLICHRDDSRQEHLDGRKLSKALGHMQGVSRETRDFSLADPKSPRWNNACSTWNARARFVCREDASRAARPVFHVKRQSDPAPVTARATDDFS